MFAQREREREEEGERKRKRGREMKGGVGERKEIREDIIVY